MTLWQGSGSSRSGGCWGLWLLGQVITVPISPVFLLSSCLGHSGALVLGDPPLVLFDVWGPLTQGNPCLGSQWLRGLDPRFLLLSLSSGGGLATQCSRGLCPGLRGYAGAAWPVPES